MRSRLDRVLKASSVSSSGPWCSSANCSISWASSSVPVVGAVITSHVNPAPHNRDLRVHVEEA